MLADTKSNSITNCLYIFEWESNIFC